MDMYFYEVLVSSQRYHGSEALTYSSELALVSGVVVLVPFGNQQVLGIVVSQVPKPSFETKPISKIVVEEAICPELLQLHAWLLSYYPGPLGFITQLFLPSSLGTDSRTKDTPKNKVKVALELPPLTDEQTTAVKTIEQAKGSFLLHGETGSGKTRVYQELASKALRDGTSVMVLTPEIGLTPQLTLSFEQAFPGRVIVTHSAQTPAARRDIWLRIHTSKVPLVIIGPRSVLFSPLRKIGLIVLDEAHDGSYKQEQMPYYQSSRVAAKLAELHRAKLVLGSATPLVQDYFVFKQKGLPIIEMRSTAIMSDTSVSTTVVDLKDRTKFSRSPWLSDDLIHSVEYALSNNLQSLLFLNRRGTARLVLCKNCGWQASCPRCDLPLTYHGDTHHLRCHTCGYTMAPPSSCPSCSAVDIQFKSIGTKTVATEVTRIFPKATVKRFDSDTLKIDRLEGNYESVKEGSVDILVGTQMITKGLDLPKLSVVGVIAADTSLYFPDYSAEERTFQMLRQVIGRVGRGHNDGQIIIQTFYPDAPSLVSAITKNYGQFYDAQTAERELYKFPPYYFVLKLGIERSVQSSAKKAAHDLAQKILQAGLSIELIGPAPAFVEKARNKYRWQIVVKSKQRSELVKVIGILPKNCTYDIDPSNLL